MLEYSIILFFPFLMILAASQDLLSMTISNWVSLALIAGFTVFSWAIGMAWSEIAWHWALFALVLSITFTLFAFNIIGGGDAKLAPCTALWLGWHFTLEYVLLTSIFGGLLTIMIIIMRAKPLPESVHSFPGFNKIYRADNGIPYGIAMGIAGILIYPDTPWMDFARQGILGG